MKCSQHNIAFYDKNKTLVYNSLTGAKIELEGDYSWLESDGIKKFSNYFDKGVLQILIDNGILVNEIRNEFEELVSQSKGE